KTDELDDLDTADLYTEISRTIDKRLWFLEAHLQVAEIKAENGKAATITTQKIPAGVK
ncbi:MAG: DNA starvation/stationary phase protection protein Dps, partial [Nostoc sp.]